MCHDLACAMIWYLYTVRKYKDFKTFYNKKCLKVLKAESFFELTASNQWTEMHVLEIVHIEKTMM